MLRPEDIDRIVEMAWEDRTPFEAILFQFALTEAEVIQLVRRELKPGSFRRWRDRNLRPLAGSPRTSPRSWR